ncbi:MAG: undecaprenyldiphospho-muramoylpentapeptide beta-N-acetylglucosaminyltransferase [Defluviitaleaceae bacterium]|nr:undecaprenyldiphospho-muramoylpentapeptide beta-N-acetylglucosaminyltransferase [Defluviitaleaceae bacterium]
MKIILTGGGTAGHVTPNLALLPHLTALGHEIEYIGSKTGIEHELIKKTGIPYHGISSGKMRRYFSFENFADAFRVVKGLGDAIGLMRRLKPDLVFSKGGFVSVPVVIAAGMLRIPVIIHESDISMGLANKIAAPFAKKICAVFPETMPSLPKKKAHNIPTPIRSELFEGSRIQGLKVCGFNDERSVLLIMGGSLGSVAINKAIRENLDKLLQKYNIIHICGAKNVDSQLEGVVGYKQFGYIDEEMPHVLAAADIVISRAGSNSINEFAALRKPNLLIPLSRKASRGDQILNAASFETRGFSMVIQEEDLNWEILSKSLEELYVNRGKFIAKMEKSKSQDGIVQMIQLMEEVIKSGNLAVEG